MFIISTFIINERDVESYLTKNGKNETQKRKISRTYITSHREIQNSQDLRSATVIRRPPNM